MIKQRWVRYKVFFDRSRHYVNYIKTFFMIAVAYKIFEDSDIGIWFYTYRFIVIPVSIIGFIFMSLVIGYFDKKLKIREREISEYNITDSNIQRLHRDLDIIKEKLNCEK